MAYNEIAGEDCSSLVSAGSSGFTLISSVCHRVGRIITLSIFIRSSSAIASGSRQRVAILGEKLYPYQDYLRFTGAGSSSPGGYVDTMFTGYINGSIVYCPDYSTKSLRDIAIVTSYVAR